LPVSILWLSIACISICTKESIEHRASANQLFELHKQSDCNGCPLGSVPKATIPLRSDFQIDLQVHVSASPSIVLASSAAEEYRSVSNHTESPVSHTPLARLPMLRI
jgi:hypothetical protein